MINIMMTKRLKEALLPSSSLLDLTGGAATIKGQPSCSHHLHHQHDHRPNLHPHHYHQHTPTMKIPTIMGFSLLIRLGICKKNPSFFVFGLVVAL